MVIDARIGAAAACFNADGGGPRDVGIIDSLGGCHCIEASSAKVLHVMVHGVQRFICDYAYSRKMIL